jgi:hypothetical protein
LLKELKMQTYEQIRVQNETMRRCKSVKEDGCGKLFKIDEFPGSNRTYESGITALVRQYWCKTCYNRRNRKNEKKRLARNKLNTSVRDNAVMGYLYFCCVPAPAMSMELRYARQKET